MYCGQSGYILNKPCTVFQLKIIWAEVQLFLCMRVNTIMFCFIMYVYNCEQIWLLLCQGYVPLTQLLYATCWVVYRILIAHAKIMPYTVVKRNLSLTSSTVTRPTALSLSLLSTLLLIFLFNSLHNVCGTKHDKLLIKSNNAFGMIGLLEEVEDV
jgi:hypothetical protein